MDLRFSPEDDAYRARLRAWLEDNVGHAQFARSDPLAAIDTLRSWQRRVFEAGYLGLEHPPLP